MLVSTLCRRLAALKRQIREMGRLYIAGAETATTLTARSEVNPDLLNIIMFTFRGPWESTSRLRVLKLFVVC